MLVEQTTPPQQALGEDERPLTVTQRAGQHPRAVITSTSWLPREEMRLSDWVEQGRRLGVIGRGVGWWIGDWLRYGNMKWGERYARASRITGYDSQTLMNMVYVATAYEPSQRRRSLSFSHHAELAALPPDARERWLELAEGQRMSVRCLREELRRARRLAAGEAEPAQLEAGDAEADATPEATSTAKGAGDQHALHCPQCGCKIAAPTSRARRAGSGRGRPRRAASAAH